jgi:hypothetical protein
MSRSYLPDLLDLAVENLSSRVAVAVAVAVNDHVNDNDNDCNYDEVGMRGASGA